MAWSKTGSLLLATALLAATDRGPERIEALEPHMGTMFRIVLYAHDAGRAHDAIRAAFERVAELDGKLSDYNPSSELNRVCREAVGRDLPVSDDLYFVLGASQALAARTDGAFDVTVGPVVRLWRIARETKLLPSERDLAAAMLLTGYRKMHLGDRTLRLERAGMQIDLGAIAKGYAADEALRLLRERGFPRALVAASGDLAIGDAPPGKEGWEIGVGSNTRTVQLHNAAVSTSGDAEQYVEIGGVRYSHIVNPLTGMGLTHRIAVSVIARKGIDSDSLATAASVIADTRGEKEALKFIETSGAQGITGVTAEK